MHKPFSLSPLSPLFGCLCNTWCSWSSFYTTAFKITTYNTWLVCSIWQHAAELKSEGLAAATIGFLLFLQHPWLPSTRDKAILGSYIWWKSILMVPFILSLLSIFFKELITFVKTFSSSWSNIITLMLHLSIASLALLQFFLRMWTQLTSSLHLFCPFGLIQMASQHTFPYPHSPLLSAAGREAKGAS